MKTRIFKRNESRKKLNGLLVLGMAVSLAISPAPVWAGNDNRSINQGGTAIATKAVVLPQQPVVQQGGTTTRSAAPPVMLRSQSSVRALTEAFAAVSDPVTIKIEKKANKPWTIDVDLSKAAYPGNAQHISRAASWIVRTVMGASLLEGQTISTTVTPANVTCHISPDLNGENEQDIELSYGRWGGNNKYRFKFVSEPTVVTGSPYSTQILRSKQGTRSNITVQAKYSRSNQLPNDYSITVDLTKLALAARYNTEDPGRFNIVRCSLYSRTGVCTKVVYTVAGMPVSPNDPDTLQEYEVGISFLLPQVPKNGKPPATAVYTLSIIK